jgi:hypothetical protein
MRKLAVVMIVVLFLASACIQSPVSTSTNIVTNRSLPLVTSFNVSPPVITVGQTASLVWNVVGATSVTINQGIGTVPASGSQDITPTSTSTYTLIADNSYGTATAMVAITVNPISPPPVSASFNVTPSIITPGQSATLQWNVTGADTVRIDPGIGSVPVSGSEQISPATTTTYILTATNAAGIITDSTTLSVSTYLPSDSTYFTYPVYPAPNAGEPIIVSFAVNPAVVVPGESATVNWDVTGADFVVIDQGIGQVPAVGSFVVTPYTTTYYTLTATNSAGSSYASTIVTVYPVNSYPSYPPIYPYVPPQGSKQQEGGHTGENGDHRDMLPRINLFQGSPTKTDIGHSTELQWKVNGATSVHIDQGIGDVPPSGTKTVTPNHTTVYTLTASNATGEVQHTQEIVVPRTLEPKKPKVVGGG